MKVAIEINGVLRDTIGKFKQLYEKHLIDKNEFTDVTYTIDMSGNTEMEESEIPFEYKILSPITSLELNEHFAFKSKSFRFRKQKQLYK